MPRIAPDAPTDMDFSRNITLVAEAASEEMTQTSSSRMDPNDVSNSTPS
jgi:hypothetical protein